MLCAPQYYKIFSCPASSVISLWHLKARNKQIMMTETQPLSYRSCLDKSFSQFGTRVLVDHVDTRNDISTGGHSKSILPAVDFRDFFHLDEVEPVQL
jgi:hypothetical protein